MFSLLHFSTFPSFQRPPKAVTGRILAKLTQCRTVCRCERSLRCESCNSWNATESLPFKIHSYIPSGGAKALCDAFIFPASAWQLFSVECRHTQCRYYNKASMFSHFGYIHALRGALADGEWKRQNTRTELSYRRFHSRTSYSTPAHNQIESERGEQYILLAVFIALLFTFHSSSSLLCVRSKANNSFSTGSG